jgi:hypothetical protein
VAVFYASGRGTVVEIHVGRIQIGGDVSFLSMVRPSGLPPALPAPCRGFGPIKAAQCKPMVPRHPPTPHTHNLAPERMCFL